MRPEFISLYKKLDSMELSEMAAAFRDTLNAFSETLARADQMKKVQTEMAIQFQEMKERLTGAEKENELLKKENVRLTQQLSLRKRDLFGSGSEKTDAVLTTALSGEEDEDPLGDEDFPSPSVPDPGTPTVNSLLGYRKRRGVKTKGKRQQDTERLPRRDEYVLDIDRLNKEYGEGNWSIFSWTVYETIESVRTTKYLRRVYTPVISAGLEHELIRIPYEGKLLKRSLVSCSLLAEIMYSKIVMALPFYRIEADLKRDGVIISRADMANWCIRFTLDLFGPVYDYFCTQQLLAGYCQSDETTLQVINDGRKASAVSFMWVHTTSELAGGNPIITFCYELTRSTQHLREYYLAHGYHGFLTSDAYVSYGVLEKEAAGDITSCGCFMHARRRIVTALLVLNLKGKSEEYIRSLPEFKAQVLVDAIYQADTPLKEVSEEERRERRQSEVKPLVDEFFAYLHQLDDNWIPSYSDRLADAVKYSLGNEKQLRMFLDDPLIPIDNGFAERSIRCFAISRRNCLFCYSVPGAEAMAILFSLAETAKACGAHPYYYYKYLLEKMPGHMEGRSSDRMYLEDMMPWSGAYRLYESKEKDAAVQAFVDMGARIPPKSPKQCRRRLECQSSA